MKIENPSFKGRICREARIIRHDVLIDNTKNSIRGESILER